MIRRNTGLLFLGLLLFATRPAAAETNAPAPEGSTTVDGVAAYANDQVITVSDVLMAMAGQRRRLLEQFDGAEFEAEMQKAYAKQLNTLIEERILLGSYAKQEAKLPEWVVDQRIDEIIRDSFNGDRLALMRALTQDRMTFEQWRDEMKNRLIIQTMRRSNVAQKVKVSANDVRRAYDANLAKYQRPARVRVRMLVLRKGEADADLQPQRAIAAKVEAALKQGGDFVKAAKAVSQAKSGFEAGRDQWVEPADLRKELADAVAALPVGGVSRPLEIEDELYVLKLEERQEKTTLPFNAVEAEIERELKEEQAKALYTAWMGRLKAAAYVRIVRAEL